jgi:hypothetical protein
VAVLVCGVVRSADLGASRGEPGAAVHLVRSGALAAAVHAHADDAELDDEDAERYFTTLVGLLDRGPVLPVRFGTIAPDVEAVRREILDPAARELARRLDLLDGCVEVRLRIDVDATDEARRLAGASPAARQRWRAQARSLRLDDLIALGQEIGETLSEVRDQLDDQVVSRVQGLAVAHAHLEPEGVTDVRHAYLVRAADLPAFDEAVRALRAELPTSHAIEYVGPLPPFEFTELELEPAETEGRRWGW